MQQADQISMCVSSAGYLTELHMVCLCFSQLYTAFSCTAEVLTYSDKVIQEKFA